MGSVYLIPVTLGGNDYLKVIPEKVLKLTSSLRYFVVEDLRSARRYLRLIDKHFPIDECEFFELNEHTPLSEAEHFLDPVLGGHDLGLMSEAGLPGIADPGALIVALAHRNKISVKPLSGPSSIILALISSGLNGQNFTFNGYLPVKPAARSSRLRELMKRGKEGYAQIFMETPYRNQQMLESVLSTCDPGTMLCIAADITLPSESVRTMRIADWRKNPPDLKGRLVIFILQ
ncbi:MAG: SAM-dependent methyltransferase [Bacteroidales bacterium]|nr:SAM-dependent methyltransferase [Bacteroidales bacterium]